MTELYRVESPYFVAGFTAKNNRCTRAAPIINWMVRKELFYISSWCMKHGFTLLHIGMLGARK